MKPNPVKDNHNMHITNQSRHKLRNSDGISLKIVRIENDRRSFMPLLLIGDESETMIDLYIDRGELFAAFAGKTVAAVCLTTDEGNGITEIKNIAVKPEFRQRGIGSRMLRHVESLNAGKIITLGTGETPSTLRFYHSNGYRYSHRVPDFFTDNYPTPIVEEGVRLKDMIYLSKQL